MFKKIMSIGIVATLGCFTFLSPIQSQANWGSQFQWIGSYNCNEFKNKVGDLINGCRLIDSNAAYDAFGLAGWWYAPAKALKPIAMTSRALACRLFAKKVWNRDANYGEPGPLGKGEVKCWNKRW